MDKSISVIIPVYNVEKFLPRCLDSIINQSYNNLEIICVNDGSPDNSLRILQEYASKDKRIIIIDKDNGGLSSARNAGMARASGEFITFIDSDDYIEANCYESCMKHFSEDVDVVLFSYVGVYENGNRWYPTPLLEGKKIFSEGMLFQWAWNAWCGIFRASALKKYEMSFREGILYEDLEFASRFFWAARPTVFYLQDHFYNYWQSENSIMGSTAKKKKGMAIQHIYILDTIYEFLKKYNAIEYFKNDFVRLCEFCFTNAYSFSPRIEHAKCISEMTDRLIAYNLDYSSSRMLTNIINVNYEITFKEEVYTKKLKGLENIFCIRNEMGCKVIRLFGKKILSMAFCK